MKWTGQELMTNPGAVLDRMIADARAASVASFQSRFSDAEIEEILDSDAARFAEARETMRLQIVDILRSRGAVIPDDFGAVPANDNWRGGEPMGVA